MKQVYEYERSYNDVVHTALNDIAKSGQAALDILSQVLKRRVGRFLIMGAIGGFAALVGTVLVGNLISSFLIDEYPSKDLLQLAAAAVVCLGGGCALIVVGSRELKHIKPELTGDE